MRTNAKILLGKKKKLDAFPKKMNFQFHQIYLLLNHQEKKFIITSQTSIKESQG